MRTRRLLPLVLLVTATLAAGCTQAKAPTWTFPPANAALAAASAAPSAAPAVAPSAGAPATAVAGTLEITAFDLGFTPKAATVPAAGRYTVTLKNTGAMTHDLTFADGKTTGPVDAGKSATVEVDIPRRASRSCARSRVTRPPG